MTIKIPSISEQISPAMGGIQKLLMGIINPNAPQQMALREALLSGRIDPQMLTDMGPEEVVKRFGKGTEHFASGTVSPKSKLAKLSGQEIERIVKAGPGNPEYDELIAGTVPGLQTPKQRTRENQQEKIGDQTIASNQNTLQKQAQANALETENRVTANQAISRVGGKQNLYTAYQQKQLSTQELQAIQATKEYDEIFRFQRDDYWKKQEMDFREKALNERLDPMKAAKEYNILLARKIVDTTSASNVQDVSMVLEDRKLEKMFDEQMKGKKELTPEELATLTPTQQRMYDAVRAVKMNRQMEGDDRKRAAMEYFRKQTSGISAMFRDRVQLEKLGEQGVNAQVDLYNELATKLLGPYLPDNEIPELAYDKKGPRSERWGPDVNTVYMRKGNDAELAGIADPAPRNDSVSNDPLLSYKGKSKAQIDIALDKASPEVAARIRQELMKRGWYK